MGIYFFSIKKNLILSYPHIPGFLLVVSLVVHKFIVILPSSALTCNSSLPSPEAFGILWGYNVKAPIRTSNMNSPPIPFVGSTSGSLVFILLVF
jgi:hypothetical protein